MDQFTADDVKKILSLEHLSHFNWFEDRYPEADEVGILKVASGWRVYSSDEKAGCPYDVVHMDEPSALADFLKRLRATNEWLTLVTERRRRELGL